MKRFTLVLTLCLAPCLIYSLSKAQDAPLWKYICTLADEKTGEEHTYHARDCHRFTDKQSEKYPKLAIRISGLAPLKETVAEFDCARRAMRTRVWIYTGGTEEKAEELDWEEVVPGSAGEALLSFACRDRSKEKK